MYIHIIKLLGPFFWKREYYSERDRILFKITSSINWLLLTKGLISDKTVYTGTISLDGAPRDEISTDSWARHRKTN